MKKIKKVSKGDLSEVSQGGSFRRWCKQVFISRINHQNCNCWEEIEKILKRLREVEVSVEIIVREIHRQIDEAKLKSRASVK